MDRKKLIYLAFFSLISFLSFQVPFTKLAGSQVSFTLFDFFAPISGAFLGFWGVLAVLIAEIINMLVKHTSWTTPAIIRLFPTLFAVVYFSLVSKTSTKKVILLVPLLSMVIFLAHPIGRQVWYYSLFWLVPLAAYKFRKSLFAQSLGATMTAHSVGGAAWIWALNLKAPVWNALIPVVIQERLLFALGISISFILVSKIVNLLISKKFLPALEIKTA